MQVLLGFCGIGAASAGVILLSDVPALRGPYRLDHTFAGILALFVGVFFGLLSCGAV